MKRICLLLPLLLAGCQTDGITERDRSMADNRCRQPANRSPGESYDQCFAQEMENYRVLGVVAAARVQAQQPAAPTYIPQPVQVDQSAAVQPNILPPTTRCQIVPAGLGTYQTICR